jgi:hypothetical protein
MKIDCGLPQSIKYIGINERDLQEQLAKIAQRLNSIENLEIKAQSKHLLRIDEEIG